MFDLLGNAMGGGLFGIIGAGVTAFFKAKEKKDAAAHQLAMLEANTRRFEVEFRAKKELAQLKFATEKERGDAEAFTASQSADRATYSKRGSSVLGAIVDFVRGIIRPAITIALISAMFYFYIQAQDDVIRQELISQVSALTGLCVCWWFGARSLEKFQR